MYPQLAALELELIDITGGGADVGDDDMTAPTLVDDASLLAALATVLLGVQDIFFLSSFSFESISLRVLATLMPLVLLVDDNVDFLDTDCFLPPEEDIDSNI